MAWLLCAVIENVIIMTGNSVKALRQNICSTNSCNCRVTRLKYNSRSHAKLAAKGALKIGLQQVVTGEETYNTLCKFAKIVDIAVGARPT